MRNDENMARMKLWNADSIQVPIGPVTRVRAKRFEESFNGLIQSIWTEINSWRPKDDVIHGPQGWISIIQALEYSRKGSPKGTAQRVRELQASFSIWVTYPILTHQGEWLLAIK